MITTGHNMSGKKHYAPGGSGGAPSWRLAAFILLLLAAGCASPKVDAVRPVEYVIFVQANGFWQDSGVHARRGQLIQCRAKGNWGDSDGTYGPDGDKRTYKDHLGVRAPAYGLLMRLSTETNIAYFVGCETNIPAERSGNVLFRGNISLPHRATGQVRVFMRVVSDTDGDGACDYDEIECGTDPLNPDTDGLGLGDLHKVLRMKKAIAEKSEDAEKEW